MATNPMQRKQRISFILGMLIMFVISALIIAFLYTQVIKKQEAELSKYKTSRKDVYVVRQDIKSGQVLTADMFTKKNVEGAAVPTGATSDVATTLLSASLSTTDGRAIYYHPGTPGNSEDPAYYYIMADQNECRIYKTNQSGVQELASYLSASDSAYYYEGSESSSSKKNIEIAQNAVIAKVDMGANTIITNSLISRSDEITTNDLRKEEYNVISLPVDLAPGEYIDVRLVLPNGQNYIVVSKKKVTIPIVNGIYLSDTIQMNLTEEEILKMSCAIIENYQMAGSKLYASRYIEAGTQSAAYVTYQPNNYVITLAKNDKNLLKSAMKSLNERMLKDIDKAVSDYGSSEGINSKTETSITSTQEQRKNYLQTLPAIAQ